MSRISESAIAILLGSTTLTMAQPVFAQVEPAGSEPAEQGVPAPGDDIIVTGTREVGTRAADAAAPVQLLSSDALEKVGQPNLNQALTQIVPSFTAQTQGTDMASFSLSARLRGVSPNHTLVMVNGKRRHGNAILQVINGAFGGSAAPSIDLIPPDIVQRIEILQDGAAAQYGSDAIAGVINIILKSQDSGLTAKGTVGQYYDSEGLQYALSSNFGLPIGDAGFLDVSLFHRWNDFTTIGEGQFQTVNLTGNTVTNVSPAFRPIYESLNARRGTADINNGQPRSTLNVMFLNAGYDFGGVEFYAFGDVSRRHGKALQGYRQPNRICVDTTNPATCLQRTVNNGMVPWIEVISDEFSGTAGFRGDVDDWNWDLGVTYAEDKANVYTTHSANASMFTNTFNAARSAFLAANPGTTASSAAAIAAGQAGAITPSDFYDGSFEFTQFVGQLDVRREIEMGFAEPLTVAVGGEYRRETYTIGAGDDASRYFEGGQSFPGYALSDASSLERDALAVYGNVILKPLPEWTVDLAGRFEDYSDFGNTTIGKFTTRYDFSDAFALRGTVSTGFRAPSLQESGYSATNVAPTSATIQLAPSSPGSAAAGFGALRPEKSFNLSGGVVLRPTPRLVMTLDGYFIRIKDRIVSSGSITGQDSQPFPLPGIRRTNLINGVTAYDLVQSAIRASGKTLDPTVLQSGSLSIQTFTNGIDTETWGLEFSTRYPVEFDFGRLDLSLGANYNKTKVIDSQLGSLFNLSSEATIEQSSPDFKTVFGALFTSGGFSANMRATYYSETVQLVTPNGFSTTPRPITGDGTPGYYEGVVKPAVIFDLELGYDFTEFLNLSVGANNLFDKKPEIPGLVADYNPAAAGWLLAGRSPYINGSGTINSPYSHGPYGTNGGYYYARVTVDF